MDLVIDANILFAALIKDSFTSELLFQGRFHLYAPEFILEEFQSHKEEILKKTARSEEEFFRLLEIFKRKIVLIPLQELISYLKDAEQISPDTKDIAYLALALRLHCPIWSNDKELKS